MKRSTDTSLLWIFQSSNPKGQARSERRAMNVNLPAPLFQSLDRLAAAVGTARSAVVLALLNEGLARVALRYKHARRLKPSMRRRLHCRRDGGKQ